MRFPCEKRSTFKTISRRKFLTFGALATGVIFWTSINYKFTKKKLKDLYYRFFHTAKNLVVNEKTGIIHHKELCNDHLPIDKNISGFFLKNPLTITTSWGFWEGKKNRWVCPAGNGVRQGREKGKSYAVPAS